MKVKRKLTYCVKYGFWLVNPMFIRMNPNQEKLASNIFIF